jgi:branched-chain amino acid aminotransferase
VEKFLIHPAASCLHYGQALFEGMKAYRQKAGSVGLFRPEFNIKRMQDGADRLCLPPVPKEVFLTGLCELLKTEDRWVFNDSDCSLYIRPTLIGTEGFLGVRPANEALFFILLSPVTSYFSSQSKPLKIWVEDKALRAAPGGLGATKAGANYASSLQAALKAKNEGYNQVLWLDVNKEYVDEVGTMNVFFVFKNEIVTPSLNGSILAGNTRDAVIKLLADRKTPVVERRLKLSEVLQAWENKTLLEVFGTGTAAIISPIGEFYFRDKNYQVANGKPGPIATEMFETLSKIHRGETVDKFNWMFIIK